MPSAGLTLEGLEQQLAQQREATAQGASAKLEDIWRRWPRKPGKPALGLAMWPALMGRIHSDESREALDRIPIARVLLRAHEIASRPRRNVVFRVVDRSGASAPPVPT